MVLGYDRLKDEERARSLNEEQSTIENRDQLRQTINLDVQWLEQNAEAIGDYNRRIQRRGVFSNMKNVLKNLLPRNNARKKLYSNIEQYALVTLVDPAEYAEYNIGVFDKRDFWFVYLGEIPNMPGHCVVLGYCTGKVYSGFHVERFRVLDQCEV